jgi:DNA-binding transcriptional ArsR family regulator
MLAYSGCVADVFKALADPSRRAILDELAEHDGATQFELCSALIMRHGIAITRQATAQHLAVLEAAGLVSIRRDGRTKRHFFDPAPIRRALVRWVPPDPGGPEPPC